MDSKINRVLVSQASMVRKDNEAGVGRRETGLSQKQTEKPEVTDTVSLTDTALRIGRIENAIAEIHPDNTQRVEEIKKAIFDGTYEINDKKLVDNLLKFELTIYGDPK
ncbi:MAG: flagellar biosynthesis anti-sigma factor FlgM [Thermodesulfobacteriota bacterium]|nr:flagellar biosynthesis anti-sigma factor FlgM [Thermodesulfobacteriota bacterium]